MEDLHPGGTATPAASERSEDEILALLGDIFMEIARTLESGKAPGDAPRCCEHDAPGAMCVDTWRLGAVRRGE
jgi:hypothetical protein